MLVNDLANRPARPARSRVLRLRGLPYRAVEDDIVIFLAPLLVIRVHVCRRNGRTTGEAYVQFATRHEAGEALRTKNRQHLGNRYIEVFEAGESDIGHDGNPVSVATTSSTVVQPGLSRSTVRIAGIVSSTRAQDVADFLEGVQLRRGLDSIIFFGDAAFGNRTAVVEVADENAYQIALSRNQQLPGNAHLQVHPITNEDLAALPRGTGQHSSSVQQPASAGPAQFQYMSARPQLSPPSSLKTDGSTLKLRGLPYTASVSDILTFFEGFHLRQDDVHLETRHDRQDNPTGTGVAYVQFGSPDTAEEARNNKHKQTMGTRYIECMTLNSGAAPQFTTRRLQALEPPMGSLGWSRPFSPQSLYPREGQLLSPAFRHGVDQGTSSSSMIGAHPPTPAQPISATLQGPSAQVQVQVPFSMQQDRQRQQQQLLMQQQYALQHQQQQQQQQQLLMQQQAMRHWGGQQWQGNMTPLGLGPQGWMRQPYPVRMAPAGPLQMSPMASRQNLQGGVALADPMAYGYPGPPPGYAWAPLHPGNPPMMGAQAFARGRQPPGGGAYPPRQDPLDTRMPYSPHGGRTPGRGSFRTPFSSTSHTRLSRPHSHSVAVTQPLSESGMLSQVAMTADSSADATSTTQVITNLEELSLTDSMSAQRLSPIVTQPGLSPSHVILASSARSNTPKGQQQPAAAAAAQNSLPTLLPQQALQISDSASSPVTGPSLTGSETGNDAVAAAEDTAATPPSSS